MGSFVQISLLLGMRIPKRHAPEPKLVSDARGPDHYRGLHSVGQNRSNYQKQYNISNGSYGVGLIHNNRGSGRRHSDDDAHKGLEAFGFVAPVVGDRHLGPCAAGRECAVEDVLTVQISNRLGDDRDAESG